jgi:hypothetical protein
MQTRERRAAQECRIAAKDQAHEIFEDRHFDRVAVELQRDAIESVYVDERNGNQAGLIIDMK